MLSDQELNHWIWITWEKHRRTRELCKAFKLNLFEKNIQLNRLIKHPYLLIWTFFTILHRKPKGIIVQNPSVILALWAIALKRLFGYTLVVDSHNAGLIPSLKLNWLKFVYKFIQRNAEITIITNQNLAEIVKKNGGYPFVLEDKLPTFPDVRKTKLKGKHNIVCISTFAEDEPYREVINAAKLLNKDCFVYMTGNYKKMLSDVIKPIPSNLIFTGFLSDEEYLALLNSADVILDLTNREDCLVCGAYEAVALEKPMILSDTLALRSYFSKGAVYAKNDSESIKKAISSILPEVEKLSIEIKELKYQLDEKWIAKKEELIAQMIRLSSS